MENGAFYKAANAVQHVRVSAEIFVETFRAKLTELWKLVSPTLASVAV